MHSQSSSKRTKHEWLSRKLWFSIFAIGMLYAGMRLSVDSAFFASVYGTFSGSVVAICGLFLTGNVIAQKFGTVPAASTSAKTESQPTSEETPG